MQLVRELEGMSCEELLRTLDWSSLERRKLRCDFIALYDLRGRVGEGDAGLFSLGYRDRTRGNDSKLHQRRFKLVVRRHFSAERTVKHWKRLPREVVDALSLSMFEAFGRCP